MIQQPDQIDHLLDRIVKEAERDEQHLATFQQRVASRIVDTALVMAISYGFGMFFIYLVKSNATTDETFMVNSIQQALPGFALIIWAMIYSPLLESTGGTLGKRLIGIKLIDAETRRVPDFRMCMARSWIYMIFVILLVIPAVLSCFAYFVSDNKQTWHDKLTNMICVKKRETSDVKRQM